VWQGLKSHPVELIVLLYATVVVMIDTDKGHWLMPAYYTAFAATAALCLSFYRSKRWAEVAYWAVLPLFGLCTLLPEKWPSMSEYWLLTALLPAVYLLARGVRDTKRFSARFFSMARSLVVALGVGLLAFLLLEIINYSIEQLFSTSWNNVERYVMSFSFILLAPMIFIGMESNSHFEVSRLEESLVNWVLTPALLIYNIVLYIYVAVILVNWDLPKGSVATMVSLFIGVAVAVRWLRPMLKRQPFGWYFHWFGLIAMPLVVIFWVAAGYRIVQYGLTFDRCILLAAGTLMTLFAVISLFRKENSGYWFIAVYALVGLVLAVGGPLSGRQMSLRSQTKIVLKHVEKSGLMTNDGIIRPEVRSIADTTYRKEHRLAYQSMKYIETEIADTTETRKRLGITSADYLEMLSKPTARYATSPWMDDWMGDDKIEETLVTESFWIETDGPIEIDLNEPNEYKRIYTNIKFRNGKIAIGKDIIDADSVLATQLALIGYTLESNLDQDKLRANSDRLCTYRSPDGRFIIIFNYFYIESSDKNYISNGEIDVAMVSR